MLPCTPEFPCVWVGRGPLGHPDLCGQVRGVWLSGMVQTGPAHRLVRGVAQGGDPGIQTV